MVPEQAQHKLDRRHRRNQKIEMYTHTSGVDHEQGSLSFSLSHFFGGGGGGGVRGSSPEKNLIFGMAGERF